MVRKISIKPKVLIIDVDGVMTTGQMIYTEKGKTMKIFGPDDHDGLSLLKKFLEIRFVTGDKIGFKISKKRIVNDMKFPLDLVSTIKRVEWISQKYSLDEVIYMGDGIFDHYVFKKILYSISTANGDSLTKKSAKYVTKRNGGDRAVAEACLHILEKFFIPYNPKKLPKTNSKLSGEWTI
jgi:3-deoxy-D-manno-octulosonate 8-phosphate phosphatase (KDO 8-P phosphatase)